MLAWQKDFASQAASVSKKNGRVLLVIGLVLIVDITLLGLFIEWAYVQHYGITSSIFFANALFSTQDHSLIESFGYLKEAAICLLLASLFLRTRVLLHLAFSTFFLVLLLDDFFSVHEQMGKVFAPVLGPSLAHYGELAGEVLFGALPLALESGVGSELRNPLGITIVGGLLLSQLLTLDTTPVIYLLLDRLHRRLWGARQHREPGQMLRAAGRMLRP